MMVMPPKPEGDSRLDMTTPGRTAKPERAAKLKDTASPQRTATSGNPMKLERSAALRVLPRAAAR